MNTTLSGARRPALPVLLLLLAGCAAAGPGVPPEARPLDALRTRRLAPLRPAVLLLGFAPRLRRRGDSRVCRGFDLHTSK